MLLPLLESDLPALPTEAQGSGQTAHYSALQRKKPRRPGLFSDFLDDSLCRKTPGGRWAKEKAKKEVVYLRYLHV